MVLHISSYACSYPTHPVKATYKTIYMSILNILTIYFLNTFIIVAMVHCLASVEYGN